MAVQAFMTLGLIFSCLGQSTSTLLLVRWPLNFVFRFQVRVSLVVARLLVGFIVFWWLFLFCSGKCWG